MDKKEQEKNYYKEKYFNQKKTINKLQEELDRCKEYLQTREIKYCEKCKCYGDEGCDLQFYNYEYLCYDCSHEYNL